MLDVSRLRVLVAVARHGSVTAAARELHYSQPSVSHHLARLEAETGAGLVQRAGRGVRLTAAGRMLAERGAEIIGRLEAAETELAAHVGLTTGVVRLVAFPSALSTFVPRAAAELAVVHPGLRLRLSEAEPPEALHMLRAGYVDVAVIFRYDTEADDADEGVATAPLLTEPTYLIQGHDADSPDELAAHADAEWIAGCDRCRVHLVRLCDQAGFSPRISFTTEDFVAVQALVAAGVGVSTLPGLALAAARHPDIRATRLPEADRHVLAATYGTSPPPPATATLIDALTVSATRNTL
jgi:molybdate transport repressor ModE-like protein